MAQLLVEAADDGDLAEINQLLAAGANPNEPDHDGYTPLMAAASRNREGAVLALIEAGADVNQINNDEETALHVARRFNLPNIVRILLEAGANPNMITIYNHVPILDAVQEGQTEIVRLLINHGADINIALFTTGPIRYLVGPPIFIAAMNGHTEIVKLLLEHPALVNKENDDGETITDLARAGRFSPEINTLILDKMARMARIRFNKLTAAVPVKLKRGAKPSHGHFAKAAPHVWETIGNFLGPKSGGRRHHRRTHKRRVRKTKKSKKDSRRTRRR
jgi:ankyrin repeat protein